MEKQVPPKEFPFVCQGCASVYRVRSDDLTAPSVGCHHCGHRRETRILRTLLPRSWLSPSA